MKLTKKILGIKGLSPGPGGEVPEFDIFGSAKAVKTEHLMAIVAIGMIIAVIFCGEAFGQPQFFEKGFSTFTGPEYVPGEIIVKFESRISEEAIADLNRKYGCSVLSISRFGKFKRLRIPKGKIVEEMVDIYRKDPNVEYAEPNYLARAFFVPNDPYYPLQWHLDNIDYGGINMEAAWDIQAGKTDIIVAVVDTGVAYEDYVDGVEEYKQAPDLANTSFVSGYDFVNLDNHPNDDNGHGTHVTGTIAQSTDNGIGVAGVAFNGSIMPVKVLNRDGIGTYFDVADGICFAADNGASVINLSLGGDDPAIILEDAVAYAYNKGVTIVAASGNGGVEAVKYPAAYDSYVIAVGATRYDEAVTWYSNGGLSLDLTAPGGDLSLDQNNDGYGDGVSQQTFDYDPLCFSYFFYQGTSMAAPHVAGVAALLIANGITSPDQVRDALHSTAEDKGEIGWDKWYGWGIVDAYAALNYSPIPIHDVAVTDITAPLHALQGDTVTVDITVKNLGDYEETFTVSLTDTTDGVEIGTQSVTLSAGASTTLSFNWDITGATIGNHVLKGEALIVDENLENNSMTTTVAIKEPVHDVAITAIDAPLEVSKGDVISVSVTVKNQGTYDESTTVTLTDTTDDVEIGTQSVALSAGASATLSFNWDTSGATVGDHLLEAKANGVPGEIDIDDNSMTIVVTIKAVENAIHVQGINMSLQQQGSGWNAIAYVTIADGSGGLVKQAVVTGNWTLNGTFLTQVSGATAGTGEARIVSGKVRARSGDVFTFTVIDVVKSGYAYDPTANIETIESITVP